MKLRLKTRASLVIIGLVAFIVVALSGALLVQFGTLMSEMRRSNAEAMRAALYHQVEDHGRDLVLFLADALVNPLYRHDMGAMHDLTRSLREQKGVVHIQVYDETGALVHDGTETLESFGTVVDDELARHTLATGEVATRMAEDGLHVAAPIKIGSRTLGGVMVGLSLVDVAGDIAAAQGTLARISETGARDHLFVTGVAALVFSVLGIFLAVLVARGLARPIEELARLTGRIGRGDYDVSVPVGRTDEIGDLAVSLKNMAIELEYTTVSKAYLDNILASMLDPMVVLAPDGTIGRVNDATCKLLGFAARELIGQRLTKILAPHDAASAAIDDAEIAEDALGGGEERELVAKDGRRIPVLLSGSVMSDAAGAGGGTVLVARDITELKQRDEQLRQAQKMEAVGQLTGGVAHDFNNLLAVVIGNLELLEERVGGDGRARDLAQRAIGAAERGAALTRGLLAFSRKQALRPQPTDVTTLLAGMIEILRRTLGEAIDIETVHAAGVWPTLVDPAQLENALLNLALNARDAMPDGGKLTIEIANVRLDPDDADACRYARPGEYVVLAVSDNGAGMAPEVAERAFEPFFTTKEVGEGSGLGLSMVYGFVKQSGGHVNVYSEAGRGTTVRIYLPRVTPRNADPEPETAVDAAPRGAGETILVVEDNPDVRKVSVAVLGGLGYATLEAADGRAALAILDEAPKVDLLFTDVILPNGMSGDEVAREARRRRPGLKVLLTSGFTRHAAVRQDRLDDGVELIEKPYRKADLASTVRDILDRDTV